MDYRNSFEQNCLKCKQLEEKCLALEKKLESLKCKTKIYPWQGHLYYVECPQCKGKYDKSPWGSVKESWVQPAFSTLRICYGGIFRSCPKIPHFHRKCKACGYKFVEHTAEEIETIKE